MSRMPGGEARVSFGAGFLRQDNDATTQIWTEVDPPMLSSSIFRLAENIVCLCRIYSGFYADL
jgi:hypothetical protein